LSTKYCVKETAADAQDEIFCRPISLFREAASGDRRRLRGPDKEMTKKTALRFGSAASVNKGDYLSSQPQSQ
jgi:hypothetical protein